MKKKLTNLLLIPTILSGCTGINFGAIDSPFDNEKKLTENKAKLLKAKASPTPVPFDYNNPNNSSNPAYPNTNTLNTVRAVEIKINEPSNKINPPWYQAPIDANNRQKKIVALQNTMITEVKASVVLNDGTRSSNVKWSSSDNSLVNVNADSGQISIGANVGKVTLSAISVLDTTKKDILEIEIVDKNNFALSESAKVNSVTVTLANQAAGNINTRWYSNGAQIISEVGSTMQVLATAYLQDGTKNSRVLWESSDEKIATVTQDGQIKAVGLGTASIIARYSLNPTAKGFMDIQVMANIPDISFPRPITNPTPTPVAIETPIPTPVPTSIPTAIPTVVPTAVPQKTNDLVFVEGNATIKSFYITKYEITQSDWLNIVSADPSTVSGVNLPVSNVSWFNAINYCNQRSKKEGLSVAYDTKTGDLLDEKGVVTTDVSLVKGYRLPNSDEWEFAAKGGNSSFNFTYSGNNDYSKVAWNASNSGSLIKEVGTKQANELGIYDMSGNLYEWVNDTSSSASAVATTKKLTKGGSYTTGETTLNSFVELDPNLAFVTNYGYLGFRIVKTK